jgi:hypothetical protein
MLAMLAGPSTGPAAAGAALETRNGDGTVPVAGPGGLSTVAAVVRLTP